ncbi:MAG: NADAR family protein [Bacteroidetes bacterium]|nr:NADAR family protein [Bacteroidota bacterium]
MISEKLGIKKEIHLQRCHRVGPKNERNCRSILVKFLLFEDKLEVQKNAKKLKGTSIYIQGSYSETTSNRRKALVPLLRYMQQKKIKCSLVDDILYSGKERYTVQSAKKLSYCQKAVNRSNSTVLAIAGQLSILSNFYECPISHDGNLYSSAEQFFQCEKATKNGQSTLTARILNTDDPVKQKGLGSSMKIDDRDWESSACMEKITRAKFNQNAELMDYLKSTTPMMLVHANAHDAQWGNGLAINDTDVLNPAKYKGKNILGDILMKIRDSS